MGPIVVTRTFVCGSSAYIMWVRKQVNVGWAQGAGSGRPRRTTMCDAATGGQSRNGSTSHYVSASLGKASVFRGRARHLPASNQGSCVEVQV